MLVLVLLVLLLLFHPLSRSAVSAQVKPYMAPRKNTLGSLPSVMVGREMVANGQMAAVLKQSVADCNGLRPATSICEDIQLYNDVTGNHGATVPEGTTAVNPGFRSGMFHIISGSGAHPSPFTLKCRSICTAKLSAHSVRCFVDAFRWRLEPGAVSVLLCAG